MRALAACCATLLVAGCSTAPNHLGNPLLLPVSALTTGLENASYNRQRAVVKEWITANQAQMRREGFQGPTTQALLATLPAENHAQVRRDLKQASPHPDFDERATVIVMVHRG